MATLRTDARRSSGSRGGGRQLLHEVVADTLAGEIARCEDLVRLPSVGALADTYHVSRSTSFRALHLLQDRGLVEVTWGAPVRVSGRHSDSLRVSDGGARLLGDLRDAIERGRLRAGAPLEKIATYCRERALSRSTVLTVFAALQSEGLIHQVGKRRLVGRGPANVTKPRRPNGPVVVIVVPTPGHWHVYMSNFHNAPLFQSLLFELDKYGTTVVPALSTPQPWESMHPGGIEAVRRLVEGLGTRYRGMLLAVDLPWFRDWRTWMSVFGREGSPVHLYCDEAAAAESIRGISVPRGCIRCSYGEAATAALAAATLSGLGHRKAAFMMNRLYEKSRWQRARMEAMAEAGAALGLSVVPVEQTEGFWQWADELDQRVMADSPAFRGVSLSTKELAHAVPSLAAVLDDASFTAIVSPNDALAGYYYVWLRRMGRTPGSDISLLSFDNSYETPPYPVSTIDLGRRTMGYQLAHLYIRDVPVKVDRDGYLVPEPHLVDRGSVADIG